MFLIPLPSQREERIIARQATVILPLYLHSMEADTDLKGK
jgi:hypothetical protein